MALFSNHSDSFDVNDEIAALRKEVASLSRALSKRGAAAYRGASHEASDLYGDIAERVVSAMPAIRKRAHDIEDTIRDNPQRTVATIGLAALVVTAAVVFASSRR